MSRALSLVGLLVDVFSTAAVSSSQADGNVTGAVVLGFVLLLPSAYSLADGLFVQMANHPPLNTG
jgi:hypothetical protein